MHPFGNTKSSTNFGWGKGGKVISARWQVLLCDPTVVRLVYILLYPNTFGLTLLIYSITAYLAQLYYLLYAYFCIHKHCNF